MVSEAVRLYELKKKIAEELESQLPSGSIRKARGDPHARRRPRPCGITIHPGHGCPLKCLYCYIYDMGFTSKVVAYPLEPLELVYALAANPYVVPTRTLAAIGSVTEPLLPQLRDRTIAYLKAITRWLHLPSQISTKEVITPELAKQLASAHPGLSVLISVSSLKKCRVLEPKAPSPELRILGGREAAKHGLRVDLFLRPIIPGALGNEDIRELLILAESSMFRGVVAGSLRITEVILKKLSEAGIPVRELIERAGGVFPKGKKQVPIRTDDIKLKIKDVAREVGLEFFQSACAANVIAHEIPCGLCRFGPCGDAPRLPSENEVIDFLEYTGVRGEVTVSGKAVRVAIKVGSSYEKKIEWVKAFLEDVYKVPFIIKFMKK
ncbi:MAG: radical SAM protein [Desulfurococcales archaeon]|nr:radical SAM protein [Desulfurococcales archaeon]